MYYFNCNRYKLSGMHALAAVPQNPNHTEENFFSYTLLIKFLADTPAILISNSTRSTRGGKKHRLKKGTEIKTRKSIKAHLRRALVSLDWRASRSILHRTVSRAAVARLKGVALVSLVESHSLDAVASHDSLRGGKVVGWRLELKWSRVFPSASSIFDYIHFQMSCSCLQLRFNIFQLVFGSVHSTPFLFNIVYRGGNMFGHKAATMKWKQPRFVRRLKRSKRLTALNYGSMNSITEVFRRSLPTVRFSHAFCSSQISKSRWEFTVLFTKQKRWCSVQHHKSRWHNFIWKQGDM